MSWAEDFHFNVEKPNNGWGSQPVVAPWAVTQAPAPQPYQTDENLKKQFGIELAKSTNPFEAGCKVFGDETSKALWASVNWMTDAIVIASRDAYIKTLELSLPPLDKEQLAAKVLALADEKILKNGVAYPTIEAKDRIAAFKLYSEIMGYTGKVEIDNSTKTINNNKLEIILVKAEEKKPVVIDAPNVKSKILNEDAPSPISLKLVKAG